MQYTGSAAKLQEKFHTACKSIGIAGESIREELAALHAQVPALLAEAGELAHTAEVRRALTYHAAFLDFTVGAGETPRLQALSLLAERGPAAGEGATLLEHPSSRSAVVNDLLELDGFLLGRLDELGGKLDISAINQFEGAPAAVTPSPADVGAMSTAVAAARAAMTAPKLQQLLLLASSVRRSLPSGRAGAY